jgi:hypothetical protein
MNVGTDQSASWAHAPGPTVTVTLDRPARSSLRRLQEHTSLSPAELTNCALTWYAYFDAQLRAGYSLTLWSAEAGPAHTLSLSATDSSSSSVLPYGRRRPPPGLAFTAVRFWIAGASIRGSPAAPPHRRGSRASHPFRNHSGGPGT